MCYLLIIFKALSLCVCGTYAIDKQKFMPCPKGFAAKKLDPEKTKDTGKTKRGS